ncbi:MAG: glycosyltransferase family 4 protein [Candidatus Omnitrophota bacterium]
MNILIVTTHLNYGGIASYVLALAEGLKIRGHEVLVASSGGDLVSRLLMRGVRHICLDINTKSELSPKIIGAFLRLSLLLRREEIEIIHAQTRVAQVLSCALGAVFSLPCVSTCHGYFRPRWGRRMFGCWGKRVIAISNAVFAHLRDDLCVEQRRIRLVYNGVEPGEERRDASGDAKIKLGLSSGPVVGIIARLSAVKGHRYLIEAMKEVLAEEPKAQLLIVGDGKCRLELLALAGAAGLSDKVLLLPARGDLDEPFSAIDVYVSVSVKEGLGLSVLEAMGHCVPVVAFKVGGICDIIAHEINGLLVSPRDSHSLAGAILRIIKDKGFAVKLARSGYRAVKEKFSLGRMIEATIKTYGEARNEA